MRWFRAGGYVLLPALAGLLVFALSLLVACAPRTVALDTSPQLPVIAKAAPLAVDLRPMCPTLKVYSPAEMSALADAISNLDTNSPIIPAFGDYKRMRDNGRACAAATK